MTKLLTAAQMRAIEQAAIAAGVVTGLELMERAGQGVVAAVLEEWPEMALTSHRAVVLCGPGNNGGDGFVVARLLAARGWRVEVFLYGDPAKLPPDAQVNCARWQAMGVVGHLNDAPRLAHQADLFVDALFGTGLGRPLEGAALNWVAARASDQGSRAKTVAVDIPSGLCSDSGRALADGAQTVLAGLSVSFHAAKLGHYLGMGPSCCGRVVVADIGLKPDCAPSTVTLVLAPDTNRLGKAKLGHKYTHGHALVLAGAAGQGGAARLAARGALRIGAGVVTIAAPPDAMAEHAAQLNAIMLKPVVDAGELAQILRDQRISALCIGPGLGTGAREAALVAEALKVRNECAPYGVVLDADALTLLAQSPALFAALHAHCVLTPHAGEFTRLFPDIAEKLVAPATKGPAYSKVDATRDAAARAGCVVLFKGADTVIAAPDGRCAVNSAHYARAAPWLATAGAGDVLAGFITGLLARGYQPMQAAETAAWLHVECARRFGPGLIAEDLAEQLPAVFRALAVN
ncbi:MAG: NAD(P)H-hydrate dehydratase [Paracoccaceae bacterium]